MKKEEPNKTSLNTNHHEHVAGTWIERPRRPQPISQVALWCLRGMRTPASPYDTNRILRVFGRPTQQRVDEVASKLHTTVSKHCCQWVRVLPLKVMVATRHGVTRSGDMPAAHPVSRHCHPACQLRDKAPRHCEINKWNHDLKKHSVVRLKAHQHLSQPFWRLSKLSSELRAQLIKVTWSCAVWSLACQVQCKSIPLPINVVGSCTRFCSYYKTTDTAAQKTFSSACWETMFKFLTHFVATRIRTFSTSTTPE